MCITIALDSIFEPGNGYPKNGYSERHIGNMIWPFVNKAEWTGITLSIVKSRIPPLNYEKCIPVVVKYYLSPTVLYLPPAEL